MLIKCKGSVPKKDAHRIRMPTQAANPRAGITRPALTHEIVRLRITLR